MTGHWLGRFSVRSRLLMEKIPLLALALVSCVLAVIAQGRAVQSLDEFPFGLRVINAVVSAATYIRQMFYPARLVIGYPYPVHGLAVWQIAAAIGLLAAISAAAWYWRRTRPYVLAGWAWYLVMLLPVIGLVQTGRQAHADRYTYLPQIGLYVALTWLAGSLCGGWRHRRLVFGMAAVVIVSALGVAAFIQTAYWRNSESLWNHAVVCDPDNSLAHSDLGYAYLAEGRVADAIAEYQRALAIRPDYASAHYNLGTVWARDGRLDDAIGEFQKAVEFDPGYALARNNLGSLLAQQGRLDEAIAQFQKSLEIQPDGYEAHNNLGNVFLEQGRLDEAIQQYEIVLQTQPRNAAVHYNLGSALLRKNRLDDAVSHLLQALEIRPDYRPARTALDNAVWKLATSPDAGLRNGAKAVEIAEQLARLTPNPDPVVLAELGAAYAEAGRFPEAVTAAGHALELAQAQANTQLAAMLRAQLNLYEARQPFRDTGGSSTNAPP